VLNASGDDKTATIYLSALVTKDVF